jgi:toxin YoeB
MHKKFLFDPTGWEEYIYWQIQDKKTLKRINRILNELSRGNINFAKFEPLKGNLAGFYSVRIDAKNRLVFKISEDFIEIIECGSHYGDN